MKRVFTYICAFVLAAHSAAAAVSYKKDLLATELSKIEKAIELLKSDIYTLERLILRKAGEGGRIRIVFSDRAEEEYRLMGGFFEIKGIDRIDLTQPMISMLVSGKKIQIADLCVPPGKYELKARLVYAVRLGEDDELFDDLQDTRFIVEASFPVEAVFAQKTDALVRAVDREVGDWGSRLELNLKSTVYFDQKTTD